MLHTIFWSSAVLLGYIYAGYPLILRLLSLSFAKEVRRGYVRPSVTVVITAFNEEAGIRAKLDNVFTLNYPTDLLNVIVASDGSTDATDSIVVGLGSDRLRLLRLDGRCGKTACQNAAVEAASSEIVIFTDATTKLDGGAVTALCENFADLDVGCVAGSLVYDSKARSITGRGGSDYWEYETGLRRAESALGSLIGVSGCLYAVRRSAYRPIPADLISDFVIAMIMREQGLRTVFEPAAVCFEETLERPDIELNMRIRVAVRSINAIVTKRSFLNPFRFGLFSWQLLSHKVLRYASPVLWLLLLISNAMLLQEPVYAVFFAAQVSVLLAGGAGFLTRKSGLRLTFFRKPYYFLLTNIASILAAVKYLSGERMVTWKPIR